MKTSKQSTLQSLREGLAYVVHTPSILLIIAVIGVISLFGINFNVILPLFATDVLHSGALGFRLPFCGIWSWIVVLSSLACLGESQTKHTVLINCRIGILSTRDSLCVFTSVCALTYSDSSSWICNDCILRKLEYSITDCHS